MKNNYTNFKFISKTSFLVASFLLFLCNVTSLYSQVKVPFNQRTSVYTPTKKIYNVKGDFTMAGNTNLTLDNYDDNATNSGNMKYVDVDGDPTTWNSSSSTLALSTEFGADPNCSNIVFAGLYWTGRASNSADSPNIFTATRQVPGPTIAVNNNYTIGHNQAVTNTSYTMNVTSDNPGNNNNNRSPIYTFTNGTNTYVFRFTNNTGANRVTVAANGGTATNVPVNYTVIGTTGTATFNTPYVITDGTVVLRIDNLVRNISTTLNTTNTQSSSFANVNVSGTIISTITESKTFNKRVVSIKGPASSTYTAVTANTNDIYYPTTADGFMYSAYAEVTDYVKANGIGSYTVADVAVIEGNGGGTGYYGGWSLIVVYENSKMKFRDVTIFDGHSYVAGSVTADFEIPVSGFNTAQSGAINMKLGVIAGEGDRGISGDYLQVRDHTDTNWIPLSHAENSTGNFFNSSIFTGGNARNPNLLNNTGLDISMFNIPNANNSVITNNQTSTRFKYGSTQDTFVIFNIAMSVDAYVPDDEGVLIATAVNGISIVSPSLTTVPNDEVSFSLDIKNLGTEAINNYKVVIPIPYNASYVAGSAVGNALFAPLPTPNNVYFDAALGATGSIVWDFGTLPLPANPSTILANLTFKLKTTTDCAILQNISCGNTININGFTSGTGAITNTPLVNSPFIQGYNLNGNCIGEPIPQPLTIPINGTAYVNQNCLNQPLVRNFSFCNSNTTVSVSEIASNFPVGCSFYNEFPVTTSSIQYTASNPFPLVSGSTVTFYAVPPFTTNCSFPFTLTKCGVIDAVNDNGSSIIGASGGQSLANVLVNDTLNGNVVTLSTVNLTQVSTTNPGVTLNTATGAVNVAAGTTSGNYIVTYQICEILNPTNCDTATVTVTVTNAAIDAVDDLGTPIVGATGGQSLANVLINDTLNGSTATLATVNLTQVSTNNPNVTLNPATGAVNVAPGTPTGSYTVTYQICEKINPTNCDVAIVSVPVVNASIDAVNDNGTPIVGANGGQSLANVLVNDTLNGTAATLANVNLTQISTTNGGVSLNPLDGSVNVASGTPSGNYTVTYQICEQLNPTNCDTATVTVSVIGAAINANNDTGNPIVGATGGQSFTNVLINDTLNGNPATLANINLTQVSTTNTGVTLDTATGSINVASGTPSGSYVVTYQICEQLNPTNCDTATVTVPVTNAVINAVDDLGNGITGALGGQSVLNVLINDTLNGNPATLSTVLLTQVSTTNTNVTLNPANGSVNVTAGTPSGNYVVTYQICEILNPTNCDTATVTVPVNNSTIRANNDIGNSIIGATGGQSLADVLVNDTLNGNPATLANVSLTQVNTTNPNVTLNPATGSVNVAAGTSSGTYIVTYQICEILNPTNCDTATVTVIVTNAIIDAVNDNGTPIVGASGGQSLANVLVNDTLNGNVATLSTVNLTQVSTTNPGVTLNTSTGAVNVAPGTSSGTYVLTYEICEKLNPLSNCDQATVTVEVTNAVIDAINDSGTPIVGASGGQSLVNVLVNDTLNGSAATLSNVNLTQVSTTNPGVTLNPLDGSVNVAPGTPSGNYIVTYQICEKLNPLNCDTATVTVSVNNAPIDAVNDTGNTIIGASGGQSLANVLINDTLNGNNATLANVNLTQVSTSNPNITLDPVNGSINVAPGTPAGSYLVTYQICEKLNPTNCDTATVTVPVGAASIIANDDTGTPVNGANGGTAFTNVLINDTLNGILITNPLLVSTTFVSSTNSGVTLVGNNVVVAPGTPAGNYTLTYSICEVLNPLNCDTAIVTVTVSAAPIVANDDSVGPIVGIDTTTTNVVNVFTNDTVNGILATTSNVILTTTIPNPYLQLNPDGSVDVLPNAPAGNLTLTYQICEVLNPANCDTAVVTVSVVAPIMTVSAQAICINDVPYLSYTVTPVNFTPVNGVTITWADSTNVISTMANLPLSGQVLWPGATIDSSGNGTDWPGWVFIDNQWIQSADGFETLRPTAIVTFSVNPSETIVVNYPPSDPFCTSKPHFVIDAVNDTAGPVIGTTGATNVVNVFTNDTLNTTAVNPADVTLTTITPNANLVLNPDGSVDVIPNTPAGTYTLTYQICENAEAGNCDTATVTVIVAATPIVANDDNGDSINSITGGTAFTNVLVNDTLNGTIITNPSLITTSFVSSTNAGITLSGTDVIVASGTPAGSYTLTYQICEVLNPTNCDTAVVTVTVYTPSLELLKEGTYSDSSLPAGVSVGDTIIYSFTITNTSSVTLTNITISDPLVNVIGGPLASLAPGASNSNTFTAIYIVTQADIDAGQVNNLATATGTPPSGPPVTDTSSDPTPCTTCQPVVGCPTCTITDLPTTPSIQIIKDGTYVDANGDGITNVGDTITYNFVVTNTGNVTLTNITVTDNNAVVSGGPIPTLAVGASDSTTFTAIHTITSADIVAGQVNNLALATGTPPSGPPVSDESSDPTPCSTCEPVVGCPTCTITPLINAVDDILNTVACDSTGVIGNVLSNDTFGSNFVNTSAGTQVTLTIISASNPNIIISNTGVITMTSAVPVGTYTYTYKICSVSSPNTCDQATVTINVVDVTNPTWTTPSPLPQDITVSCSNIPVTPILTATDSCSTPTVTHVQVINPGTCPGNYTIVNTWTATDASNNDIVHIQTITVQDTSAPTFVEALPANVTVECSAVPTAVVLTAIDNCGTATVAYTETVAAGTCAGSYTITRTWIATDLCGLSTTHVQTITVQDTTAPTFVETLPVDTIVECSAIPTAVVLTATDNCGTATVAYNETIATGTCAGSYTITRTWIATDSCGLTTTHVQTITVQDTTAPTFVEALPTNETVECSAVPTAVVLTATDNCGTATVAFSETTTAGTCAGSYTLTRTWIATDSCGLTTTHVQTITVQDTTAPTFVETLPANVTVECSAVPTAVVLTATDNCGTATVAYTETVAAGTCAGSYTITRTWIATDSCGLTTTHVQTITVQDTTAPTFVETLPANVTVECSAVPTAVVLTATDNCGTATVAYTETTTAGSCPGSYTLTRTWIATDACGLTTTHVQTITVQDTTAPTFVETLPVDTIVECSAIPTAVVLTATDNCGTATVAYTETTTAGTCAGSYTLTRTWIATDACGLTTTHVQTITVQDTTAPTFVETLPVDTTVECSAVPTAVVLTATDNCGRATVAFTETVAAGTCAGSYTITRTWIATDPCGLTTTHVQTITVQDTTAPTFVEALPTNETVECSAVPTAVVLTATDNCGTATVAYTETTTAGTCAGSYTLTRTWIATDLCGLSTTHVQTITVQDTTAPTFVEALPTNETVECSAVPTAVVLTATDNCGTATVAYTETTTAGTCAGSYTLTRTWIATDLCGLSTTHVQTITVQDTTAPTFVEALPANVTVECSAVPTAVVLTATDNCGTATVAYNETTIAGSCAGSYTLTRTWIATDACGLTTTHVQTITVQDTTAPTFVEALPTNVTVECSAVPTAVVLTATDNCGTATVAYTETTTAGSCAGSYTLTRTWIATDSCGLTTTHVQTITVQDTTAPTFVETLPVDLTVECSAIPTAVVLTATDNCGTATVAYTETTTAGTCAGSYTLTRTWIATDLCGLSTTHVQTITVQDTTAPTFVEALPTNVTVECSAVPTAVVLTATDNCGTATVAYTETTTAGSCAGSYTLTRTWIATDACGLTTTHVQTITVQDTTAPTFVEALPANVTVECSAVPTAVVLTATDNCGTATVAYTETTTAGSCAGSYTLTRTWIATDACGLTTTHVQTITVQDTTAPTFVEALPTNETVECSAVPTAVVLTATDNCGTATVAYTETTTAGSCAGSYTLTRTWIATDLCGLSTTHVQTITVQDTTAPTFVEALPANVTVECSAVPTAVVLTATDNCGTATVAYNETTIAGSCAGSYTLTRTWIATDACGLTTTHVQTITVQDTTAPTFVEALPTNVTVECSAVPTAVVLTATDNCGTATVAYTETTTAGSCAGSYTLTRTWIATDSCGLTTTHVQTITVQDTTAPTFVETLPVDLTVECSAIPTAVVLTATDNCGTATVAYTETTTAGTCAGSYTLTRTWIATDLCGLSTTHVQTITVQDTTAPTFVEALPTNVTVECSAVPTAVVLTATDNCGTATVAYTETTTAGSCAGSYTLTRTWIATDACGLTTTHVQTITVQDTTAPTFVEALPANVTVECSAVPTAVVLTATDNCGTATVAYTETTTAGSCAGSYTLTRTWIATDACGLTTTHVQTITVQDTTAPTFVEALPTNETVECSAVPTAVVLTATDNCGTATVAYTETTTAGSCAGSYTLTRTWIATDLCGLTTTHVQTITVQDTTAPTFVETLPVDLTVECSAIPTAVVLTATDNCGTATVAYTETTTAGSCAGSYTLTRTWIATDACGLTTTHVQTITVQDTTAPTFVEALPTNVTVECSAVPTAVVLTATDNCGTATVAYTETTTAGTCAGSYTLTRTWIATDSCGLTTTHVQTITVQDTTAPTFVEALPTNVTVECSAVPTAVVLTATDNCGTATVAYTETTTAGTCAGSYTLTRTWIATDACGLSTTHVQTITVQDTTAPTFVEALPANETVECSAIPTAVVLTATDNCGTATVAYTETTTAGTCAGSYTITRTWIATDLCGLSTTHVQTITVQDTTAPTFVEALPANVTVECSSVPTAVVLTATDNCGTATVAYTETIAAGTCAGSYTLTRTWIATDSCGLTTTHVQTITVQDTTAPTFVEALPTNVTVECSAVPTAVVLTATDNCGTATVAYNETIAAGTCAGSYTITRTWIATDACGLTTTHVQTITVQDTTAPTFVETLPVDTIVECSAIPTAVVLTATDNCGTATVAYNETTTAGSCAGSYTLTRTWIATDLCGLSTTHVQTITVQDTTAPTFVEALPTNVTVECSAVPTAVVLTATDNCGTATVAYTETTTAGTCAGSYTLTRTWIATDACGLTTTHVQTITVQDTTAPTFVEALPANETVECSAIPTAVVLTATDNCGTATVAYNETTIAGSCAGSYTLTRTWIATDACGLTTTHVQTITVQDTTAPTFVEALPTNVTVECSAVPTAVVLTATDNCGTATVAYTETTTAGSCAGSYTLTRTWIATDSCGLTTTHVQTITVQDTTAPTFVETLPVDLTVECSAIPTAVVLTATDNCGTATVAYTETTTAGTCAGSYTLTRTWIATDLCGLSTTHVQTITVQDTTAPTFVEALPTNVTVECSAVPTAVVLTATDNCGTATVAYTETTTAGSCAGSYTLTRTWIATDACGLTTTHVQTITVQDTTAPTFVEALPANVTVECSAVPTAVVLTATDNCGTATVAYTETTTAGSCAGSYTLTRTWIATDACGLTTTHVQTITVQDTTAPTFVEALPTNETVECSAVPTAVVLTATDNCGTATVAYTETTTAGSCAGSYTLTRTWIATDLCGLSTTHVQTITVQDTTAPTFVEALPANVTVECSAVPTAVVLTATDNCGTATVAYTETTTAGSCAGSYTLTRTWIATDLCGLSTTHVQTITVQDTTAPTFVEALPTNVTVECSAVPTAVVLTATDNCGTATVAYTETTTAGSCPGSYTLTRTWIATDLCGLSTTHVQTITVQDTTAPIFVEALPANVTVECSSVPTAVVLTATDNCGTATVAYTETTTAGTCAGLYTITRTWIATDACGLTTTHVQTITVQDTTAPVLTSTLDTVINVNCDAIPDMPVLVFSDACTSASDITITSTETPTDVSADGSYTIIRTWTASDSCNNQSTVTQTVNVTISDFFRTIVKDSICPVDIDLIIDIDDEINAQYPGVISSNGTYTDVSNSGALNESTGEFTPLNLADGDYIVRYENNDPECPRVIEITLKVRRDACVVGDCITLVVHNAFTPNGDGTNEYFSIENITDPCYAQNTVEIYNRWGVLVFEVQNYNNADKVFRGISEGRNTVKQSAELPNGTYFYILKYKTIEGDYSTEKGYLYLTR